MSNGVEVKVYNQDGKESGVLKLSEKVFSLPWNPDLVHQVIVSEAANKRKGTAHTKDRSEVSGGGRKPWRQKGTGRARHGSIRSPLWIGGGITHGPRRERNYGVRINKKMKRKATLTLLSQKLRDQEILFLDNLSLPEGKTKKGAEVFKKLSKIKGFESLYQKSSSLVLLPAPERTLLRSLRNIKNIELSEARNLNPAQAARHKFLVVPKESVRVLEESFSK